MEEQKNEKNVNFENCKTAGDEIKALTDNYTNSILGEFILEQTLREVKERNAKIKKYVDSLKGVACKPKGE